MVRRALLVLMLIAAGLWVASPAQADDRTELSGCQYNTPAVGEAGYEYDGGEWTLDVMITVGWQYVGGSGSTCEDINISPNPHQTLWNGGTVKVRTYMCSSSGSCWHNAWRNCQGGCVAAYDMVNGTRYQVHILVEGVPGTSARLYD